MTTQPRNSRNPKKRAVKRSLSYSPAAWRAIETLARRRAKAEGGEPNYSATASVLVLAGAGVPLKLN